MAIIFCRVNFCFFLELSEHGGTNLWRVCHSGIEMKTRASDLTSQGSLLSLQLGIVVIVSAQALISHSFKRRQLSSVYISIWVRPVAWLTATSAWLICEPGLYLLSEGMVIVSKSLQDRFLPSHYPNCTRCSLHFMVVNSPLVFQPPSKATPLLHTRTSYCTSIGCSCSCATHR